ncbi:MFS transporter [Paenibacillus koleovorans]|uniref:MFS transporter n=1 Tax=Paenibacillus koleovorans TaxID=121608 RepID=UPI0013E32816|nr:MFS transporter [Paenibacillus koleovorans]
MSTRSANKPISSDGQALNAEPRPSAKDELLLRLFSFTFYITMAITVSFFPLYFDYKGYTKIQIGALYSIGPLIGIFANLIWGLLSDKLQTVKKLFVIIFACQLVTTLILLNVDTLIWLYTLMTFFYFFHMPINSLIDSLIMITARQTGKSYASYRVWGSLGFAFSALVFGFLFKWIGIEYALITCLGTITLSLILATGLRDRPSGSSTGTISFKGFGQVIGSRRFLWFLFLVFILSIAHRTNDGFLALYLRSLGASDAIVGWAWFASAASEIPVFIWVSRHGHKYRELPLLMIAGLVYAVRFGLYSIVDSPEWIILLQTLHSFSFGIFLSTALRYMLQLIPEQFRATGQAIYAVVWSSMAGFASGVMGGWVFDAWGPHKLYLIASMFAVTASVLIFFTYWFQERKLVR